MEIRNAVVNDLDDLIALNDQVQSPHISLFPDMFRPTDALAVDRWFKQQMDDAATSVLLAFENNRAIAYLVLRMDKRDSHVFEHARRCAYIDQVCVAVEFRNRGIARALIEEAKRRAAGKGMTRLELDVWSRNEEARTAF